MNTILTQISVDLLLIARLFAAFSWGVGWAVYLQFNRQGQFLVEKRTWITVVIGVGVDLLIAYNADWWTVCLVIVASSVGIIARSLWNEAHEEDLSANSYKIKWALEDATAISQDLIDQLDRMLRAGLAPEVVAQVSQMLARAHRLKIIVSAARRGEYTQKVD